MIIIKIFGVKLIECFCVIVFWVACNTWLFWFLSAFLQLLLLFKCEVIIVSILNKCILVCVEILHLEIWLALGVLHLTNTFCYLYLGVGLLAQSSASMAGVIIMNVNVKCFYQPSSFLILIQTQIRLLRIRSWFHFLVNLSEFRHILLLSL